MKKKQCFVKKFLNNKLINGGYIVNCKEIITCIQKSYGYH